MLPDLPGWDSLPTVTRYHNLAEIAGIGILALLVVMELVAYQYGQRKDGLTEKQQTATDQRHDEEMTRLHVEASRLAAEAESSKASIARAESETAKANEAAAKANERTAELKLVLEKEIAARQPRRINPQQRMSLLAALSKIADKGAITVSWKLFDEEAEGFGKQILQVSIDSGFPAKEVRGALSFGVTGQVIAMRDFEKLQNKPSWVADVQAALETSLGLDFNGSLLNSTFKPEFGEVSVIIGAKP